MPTEPKEHPVFARVREAPEPWRSHFPKSQDEAESWRPITRKRALAMRVLVVAQTRIEFAWSAYCAAVAGYNHADEQHAVLDHGDKLPENVARALFPEFTGVPYAH